MESFPEMTSKVTRLLRATGIEDPGPGVWSGRRTHGRTRRCPSGPGGGRSPRSTSWRSWPPTTPPPDGEKGALLRREGLYSSHIVDVAPGP